MNNSAHQIGASRGVTGMSFGVTLLLAASCGCLVANVYYAQPIIGLIGPSIGLRPELYSLVVTLTQLGYVGGLLFLVPLGDMLETRRLVCLAIGATAAALLVAAVAPGSTTFLIASFAIGISATATQMLVPLAAHLSDERSRGRAVGNVMSGLLLGILLARPLSSLLSGAIGWRGMFAAAAGVALALALLLRRSLPVRRPESSPSYLILLKSLWQVLRDTPVLRRRMAYQAPLFAVFSLFWTAVPLELASPAFGLTQNGIALFALAGAAGALVAPLAGRVADRGWTWIGTGIALVSVLLACGLCWLGGRGSLPILVVAAIVLDAAVQGNQVLGQRAIYSLAPGIRSRLNGLFIAGSFVGGALGSATASVVFVHGGWGAVAAVAAVGPLLGLLLWLGEPRAARQP